MKKLFLKLPPWTFSGIVLVMILYLTLAPHPLPDTDIPMFPGADKLVHTIMFGGLAGSIAFDIARKNQKAGLSNTVLIYVFIITVFAGGIIEIAQHLMAMGRGCELWDFVADGVGALVAVLVSRRVAGWLLSV